MTIDVRDDVAPDAGTVTGRGLERERRLPSDLDLDLEVLASDTTVRPRRRHRLPAIPRGIERLIGIVALLAIWELAARVGWISPKVLAGPSTVLSAGLDMVRDGTLQAALWASLQRVLWGLGLGIPIGLFLAVAAGLSRAGDDLLDSNLQMLRFVPIIALQPLLILWLGIGETAKVSLIVLGVAFPVYVNTHAAIKAIDPGWTELADVVGLGTWARIRRIVIPGVLPGFLVGVRLATAVAWLLLVFTEQINAQSGIGYLMIRAQTFFQSDVVVVGLIVYAVLGIISDSIVRAIERRALRWQPARVAR
jgi:sulfonate transport system permease protein